MKTESHSEQVAREILIQVETHIRGMWRFRWKAMLLAWVLCIVGWIGVYLIPNVYQAQAKIYIDTENSIKPLLEGLAISPNVMSEVNIVTREMLSRPNLAEVARQTDLDIRTTTPQQFEELLTSLQNRIKVEASQANIFSISFEDVNRDKAIAVVESLVNILVERSLGGNRTETGQAQKFLEEQIREYERRLTVAEDLLAKFKRDNVAMMPDQRGDYFARLKSAEIAVEATREKLALANERRIELRRQLEGEEPVFGLTPATGTSGGSRSATSVKIAELEKQLKDLRLQFTDKHPRIGQLLENLEMLKKQEEAEAAALRSAGVAGAVNPLDLNPVYQNMKIQLSNTEVDIASLTAELRRQEEEVRNLSRRVDSIPQVEAELNRLNRDYGVVKTRYEQLLLKLETAHIGDQVDKSIDEVQFRIIEPPFGDAKPSGPMRPLFVTVVFLASLAAAGGLAFVQNQLNPVFNDGRTITRITGIPVLGSVRLLRSQQEKIAATRDHRQLAGLAFSLIVTFTIAVAYADDASHLIRTFVGRVT